MSQPVLHIEADTRSGFTTDDYLRMYDLGAFDDIRVELVEGELHKMMPSHFMHGEMNMRVGALLYTAYRGTGWRGAVDLMIAAGDQTIRGADVAIVAAETQPNSLVSANDILLLVEIAVNTLTRDLGEKLVDYAGIAVPHYWVIDVEAGAVHVMQDPQDGGYRSRTIVRFGELLAVPGTDRTIVIEATS